MTWTPKPLIGPAAHHGSTSTTDPRIPGVTSGGDGAQPAGERPHREILIGAMVLVLVLAALGAWVFFKPAGADMAARASASEAGLIVSDTWRVESIDGGFRLIRSLGSDPGKSGAGYYFDVVETDAAHVVTDPSSWNPDIAGATAQAAGEPPVQLFIDAGSQHWVATPNVLIFTRGDDQVRSAWYDLENSISFASGA